MAVEWYARNSKRRRKTKTKKKKTVNAKRILLNAYMTRGEGWPAGGTRVASAD